MSVQLHFNDQSAEVTPSSSLFDYAESLGLKVPTSCRKQGKCKECLVEINQGMECLSAPSPEEKHLKEQNGDAAKDEHCRCRFDRSPRDIFQRQLGALLLASE